MGEGGGGVQSLRAALQADSDHAEARIYLANVLYDRAEFEGALYHFERTKPEDHWDELGIWRVIELKRSSYRLHENDAELGPWNDRLAELADDLDDIDELLMEVEPPSNAEAAHSNPAPEQHETLGALLNAHAARGRRPRQDGHRIASRDVKA